ncbi:hypothetical protein [Bradyrhizobium sp. CB82]|uniref:aromatic-ring hydroxylase C-terminal domain-containing protein n=1 Tax=Bradyrhizobium sp. CB82 TaxID=3039159 RepID=UPI0032C234FF
MGGEWWKAAADAVEDKHGIAVAVVTIGPVGCAALDIYADWYRQCEIEESGCVLVRPDTFVAWRIREATPEASLMLEKAR